MYGKTYSIKKVLQPGSSTEEGRAESKRGSHLGSALLSATTWTLSFKERCPGPQNKLSTWNSWRPVERHELRWAVLPCACRQLFDSSWLSRVLRTSRRLAQWQDSHRVRWLEQRHRKGVRGVTGWRGLPAATSDTHQLQGTACARRWHLDRKNVFVNRWFAVKGGGSTCSCYSLGATVSPDLGTVLSRDSKAGILTNLKGENSTSDILQWVLHSSLKHKWGAHGRSCYLLWLHSPWKNTVSLFKQSFIHCWVSAFFSLLWVRQGQDPCKYVLESWNREQRGCPIFFF